MTIRLQSLYYNGSKSPYVEYRYGAYRQPSSHQCQPADVVIKPRAASLRTNSHCSIHDCQCDSAVHPKMSTSALLIGGRVIRLWEVNSPCRLQHAKFWLPLVELQKARTFVSLSKSAALHGVAARSVVVQVFDSLSSGPLRDAMRVHRRVGICVLIFTLHEHENVVAVRQRG